MRKLFIFFIISLFISACTLNPVINHHGVHFLEKKYNKITNNAKNKNDIVELLGPPSTYSAFNDNLWVYIERSTSSSKLTKLGKKKLLVSNVVLVEFNDRGLLIDKVFLSKNDINKVEFTTKMTSLSLGKKSTINNILSGMRQKINDPLGKKRKRID